MKLVFPNFGGKQNDCRGGYYVGTGIVNGKTVTIMGLSREEVLGKAISQKVSSLKIQKGA